MNMKKIPNFVNSKLEMVQKSFKSLSQSQDISMVDLIIIYDSCSKEFIEKTSKYLNGARIISKKDLGNQGSFGEQITLACNEDTNRIVILGEDDYIYDEFFFKSIRKNTKKGSFLTTYKHPDYNKINHRIFSFFSNGSKLSTVCSFAGYSKDFVDSKHVFDLYTNSVLGDGNTWKMLTVPFLGIISAMRELYSENKLNKSNVLSLVKVLKREGLNKRKKLVLSNKSHSSHIVHDGFLDEFTY